MQSLRSLSFLFSSPYIKGGVLVFLIHPPLLFLLPPSSFLSPHLRADTVHGLFVNQLDIRVYTCVFVLTTVGESR